MPYDSWKMCLVECIPKSHLSETCHPHSLLGFIHQSGFLALVRFSLHHSGKRSACEFPSSFRVHFTSAKKRIKWPTSLSGPRPWRSVKKLHLSTHVLIPRAPTLLCSCLLSATGSASGYGGFHGFRVHDAMVCLSKSGGVRKCFAFAWLVPESATTVGWEGIAPASARFPTHAACAASEATALACSSRRR